MLLKRLVSLLLGYLLPVWIPAHTCSGMVTSGTVIGCIDECEYSYQYIVKCVLKAEDTELEYLSEIINITTAMPGECSLLTKVVSEWRVVGSG